MVVIPTSNESTREVRNMKNNEVATEIEKIKKEIPTFEEFKKNGKNWIRFILPEMKIPDCVKGKYLNVVYDENNNPHPAIIIYLGIDEKERKERQKQRQQQRDEHQKKRQKVITEIKKKEAKLRELKRNDKFDEAKVIKSDIDVLKAELKSLSKRRQ
jgi:hypothetical protein